MPQSLLRCINSTCSHCICQIYAFALEQRKNEDQRTLGELFFFLVDEMADITFTRSLCILMDALMASLKEILNLSEEQLAVFTADFVSRLPQYLQNALDSRAAKA